MTSKKPACYFNGNFKYETGNTYPDSTEIQFPAYQNYPMTDQESESRDCRARCCIITLGILAIFVAVGIVSLSVYFATSGPPGNDHMDMSAGLLTKGHLPAELASHVSLKWDIDGVEQGGAITLVCQVLLLGAWTRLRVLHHRQNSTVAIAWVNVEKNVPKLNLSSSDILAEMFYSPDNFSMRMSSGLFYCMDMQNYSCEVQMTDNIVSTPAVFKGSVERPVITAPHSIVEGRNITLECSVNFTGKPGIIRWTHGKRSDSENRFSEVETTMDTVTVTNRCITTVQSNISFLPEMHHNGTIYRCEFTRQGNSSTVHSDNELLVVQGDFCKDKVASNVYNHPYYPCNLVIYCSDNNPLVYDINCDNNTCYDKDLTRCVPHDT